MRKSFLYVTFFLFLSLPAQSTHELSYKEGERMGGATKVEISTSQLSNIPNYSGDRPSETGFYEDSESISSAAIAKLRTSSTNEAGNLLLETQAKRKHFELNPNTDPLFVHANSIVANPEEALKVRIENGEPQLPITETHKCYESREVETHKCMIKRHVKFNPATTHIVRINSSRSWICKCPVHMDIVNTSGKETYHESSITIEGTPFPKEQAPHIKSVRIKSGPYRIFSKNIIEFKMNESAAPGEVEITCRPLSIDDDFIETIEDTCAALESQTDTGNCSYGPETILEGPATKTLGPIAVTRDWWHKERTYLCTYPSKNNCEPFRARGCFQTNSRCNVEKAGKCLEHEQTYTCVKYPSSSNKATIKGSAPFCLTGDCANQSWNPNQDMADVMAKLSLLKELKKEMDITKAGRIFHGTAMSCSKHCLSFSDCCGLSSGWGEDLGLTHCSEGERVLSKKRQEHKCHQVGTYCAEKTKVGGICTKKKTVFCCFESKLARIIHEQGRGQLGINWGETVKEKDKPDRIQPNCRPFSIEEFSRIDFKRINFSEIFSEVWSKIKVPDAGKVLDQFQTDWVRRLPTASELKASKVCESAEMKAKVSERRTRAALSLPAGAYSLNGNPPPRIEREEQQAEVVF